MSIKETILWLAVASAVVAIVGGGATARADTNRAKENLTGELANIANEVRSGDRPWETSALDTARDRISECSRAIAAAKKAGVKDAEVLQHEYFGQHPKAIEVKNGYRTEYQITFADAGWYCEQYGQLVLFQGAAAYVKEAAAILARSTNPPTEESTKDYNDGAGESSANRGKACVAGVDAALKGGIASDRGISLDQGTVTLGEAKAKYCQALIEFGLAFEALVDKRLAGKRDEIAKKYTAHGIKGDRLELFIQYDNVTWMGPGCKDIEDIKKLAKAKKLFQWLVNADGTHTIRKYTFKGNKYKISEKTYLTEAKAWKGCK